MVKKQAKAETRVVSVLAGQVIEGLAMMDNQEILLELKNVTIRTREKSLVSHISFSVHSGETFVIVGPSGSGKTTILKTAAGLLPNGIKKTAGNITFCDVPLQKKADWQKLWKRHQIQYVFQDSLSSFCPVYSIRQQLWDAVGKDGSLSQGEFSRLAEERAALLELPPGTLDLYPQELSGGMVQRAGLLFTMLRPPVLAFADEPTSAVDSVTQKNMADALLRVQRYHQMGIVLVTHDIRLARYMADTLLVLKDGHIEEIGPAKRVLTVPQSPYTRELLQKAGLEVPYAASC